VTALSRLLRATPFRLALGYIAVFVFASALIVGYLVWRANQLLTTKVLETIGAEVTGLSEQYRSGGLSALAASVGERIREPGSSLYILIGPDGRKVAGNLNRLPPEITAHSNGGVFRYSRVAGGAEAERLAVGVRVGVPDGFTLIVGRDIDDQRRFAEAMRNIALASVGLLALLGLGGGWLFGRSLLQRIDHVTETTRSIMAGDLSRRIAVKGSGDELDRLSMGLNEMLTRIEELMVSLREVSDNIAHDLKTPLNRLRNRAEAALRDPRGREAYREALEKIIDEADDLIKTFNALLSIARLEAGDAGETLKPVDVSQAVRDLVELYEPAAQEAGLELSVAAEDGLCVKANRQLLVQAVANLIDNAIKYAAPEGIIPAAGAPGRPAIVVFVNQRDQKITITVADRGPGIAHDDRERVQKRFVRLEKSRSRPGSGLGLSLVAAVARLHGGEVRLEDNAPGLKVVLALPAG
jgi:signal transduction histidine kinase